MPFYYDFEQPIESLDEDVEKLKQQQAAGQDVRERLDKLEARLLEKKREVYANLTSWQRVQLARHPMRPGALQILPHLLDDFLELHGDRQFRDDPAVVTGLGRLGGKTLLVAAQAKGKGTQVTLRRNFGMAHPEGYRKALRIFETASRLGCPILTIVDTPGAYPGLAAEERGQAEAIARNLLEMSDLGAPILTVIISEGGSGGALGLAVADRIYMLENAIYSVISPEGCAAILWKDAARAPEAAGALKLTADELLKMGLIDGIIPEPLGGAHRDVIQSANEIRRTLELALADVLQAPVDELCRRRRKRFRTIGT
ncbi:MAG: acetyl-CoA carboxylase carboxyltransferase subunit alpha [Candidatus Lindowbacteria bacterium RIFCSPLOWO2_02_FULL_62_12]|nr:MAG: acetyl-CoA carboxylase carboxyltransferase subunit alpha [Candidatus Lindowbacteria bacterium RIFCSPLOWO2_02_FULL_62_12]